MPYADPNRRGQTESPRQALQVKVSALYNDITRLFGNLDRATFPGTHSPEEVKTNRGALVNEIDKAVDIYAASIKELARAEG